MNIKEAKEQIKKALIAYTTKDEDGDYVLPLQKQRPVFLMGPPGIGKTAIMEQIAAEMGVGILSYSMTHHTRQSAIGLPVIKKKKYQGTEYEVSEYTMSEIVASIYDLMEETGIKEGILFLDEINCVSETLTPVMLQFLQYKIFGKHRIPEGWLVVTAGNPPEYNQSVREFDIVTWDRLKRIDVEPDFGTWKEYAFASGVHPAILTYLETKKSDFYRVESTVDGKTFVTARGWEDLSQMIKLYEKHALAVDENLISQYLQNPRIAREFAVYFELFRKYQNDYQVDRILDGQAPEGANVQAKKARFDERLSLIGLLLDTIYGELKNAVVDEKVMHEMMVLLKQYQAELKTSEDHPAAVLSDMIAEKEEDMNAAKKAGSISKETAKLQKRMLLKLRGFVTEILHTDEKREAYAKVKTEFARMAAAQKKEAKEAGCHLENLFAFCEAVFGDGQEMLVVVTELTSNAYSAAFISKYGSESYFRHNKDLMFYERQKKIDQEIDEILQ